MNYLAHLYLSCDNEDLLIGNFIADSISNKQVNDYSPEIQAGIKLHRQIDSYTDQHPIVRQGTHRLQPHHRKYSPVVIDVLYDHLLANNWKRYSGTSLADFAQDTYRIFNKRMEEMPAKMKKRLPKMIAHDWLMSYQSLEGLQFTLEKMDERTRFPSNFVNAVEHLKADYEAFNNEFNTFFPEVIAFVEDHCAC